MPPKAWSAKQTFRNAVESTDNAEFQRPRRALRLVCPLELRFDHNPEQLKQLFGYIAEIRKHAEGSGRPLLLDLRRCRTIDPVGALLLAAEVEHFMRARPGRITGWEPIDPRAQRALAAFGFYRAIGWDHPDEQDKYIGVARIESGPLVSPNIPAKLGEIAELVSQSWSDKAFSNRVHGALNEALMNVIMHAYAPDLLERPVPKAAQRWWAAGFSPAPSETWIMALDHGVGIPGSAPSRHRNLEAFWLNAKQRPDDEIIYNLVVDENRSRTGLSQHGRGLPAMIALVKDRVETGAVWIISGKGLFLYGKLPRGKELVHHFPMDVPLTGTLVLWKLGRPLPTMKAPNES